MNKKFIQTLTGWQWFKNLVIPSMKVDLSQTNAQLTDLKCGLFCFKKLSDTIFQKAELEGPT